MADVEEVADVVPELPTAAESAASVEAGDSTGNDDSPTSPNQLSPVLAPESRVHEEVSGQVSPATEMKKMITGPTTEKPAPALSESSKHVEIAEHVEISKHVTASDHVKTSERVETFDEYSARIREMSLEKWMEWKANNPYFEQLEADPAFDPENQGDL